MVIFVALKKITIYRKVTFEVGLLFSTPILFQTKSKYINFIRMYYDNRSNTDYRFFCTIENQ